MASRKDLAGLATLAGLAYMASRDKGGTSTGGTTAPQASAQDQTNANVLGAIGKNMTDTGAGTDTADTVVSSAPDVRPRARQAAATPMGGSGRGGQGGPTAAELAAYTANKKPAYETPYDRARRENRESGRDFDSLTTKLKNKLTEEDTRKALPLKSTKSESGNAFMGSTGLKKGGSVKGWGIARGARKAKTY